MPKPHKIIILWVIMLITLVSKSQTLINTIGIPITENFNSLTSSNSLSSWVQNATLKDWYAYVKPLPVKFLIVTESIPTILEATL